MSPDTKTDNVIVLTEDELQDIEEGGVVTKRGKHKRNVLSNGTSSLTGFEGQPRLLYQSEVERLRSGKAVGYGSTQKVEFIHEDYAGTPKSEDAIVEWAFDQFKNGSGARRQFAQEVLHKFGYEIEKSVEYSLVEK